MPSIPGAALLLEEGLSLSSALVLWDPDKKASPEQSNFLTRWLVPKSRGGGGVECVSGELGNLHTSYNTLEAPPFFPLSPSSLLPPPPLFQQDLPSLLKRNLLLSLSQGQHPHPPQPLKFPKFLYSLSFFALKKRSY